MTNAKAKPATKTTPVQPVQEAAPPAEALPETPVTVTQDATAAPGSLDGAYLHVRARTDGFRRCGRAWPVAGAVVPVSDFTAAEIERLHADPDLMVEFWTASAYADKAEG